MSGLVVQGAVLKCSMGTGPSSLGVLATAQVNGGASLPVATVQDMKPNVNIMPFAMCTSPNNPQVSAAQGSPQPCLPVTQAPWTPGSPTVTVAGQAALSDASTCQCQWGGTISVQNPGATDTTVP